jgi:1-acyl-sn-glycerol-3-phosphate acyltransferase
MLYRFFRMLFRILFILVYRIKIEGREHVPETGPLILCANHTSNLDPPLVGSFLQRKVHYMAKAELFEVPVLGWLIPHLGAFPVKRGGVSRESIRLAIQLLKEHHAMGIFPEGSRSNAGGMGKKGAASLALKSQAVVIGAYIPFRQMTILYGRPINLSEFAEGTSEQLEGATELILQTIRRMVSEKKSQLKN